jgi:hypothetical protein
MKQKVLSIAYSDNLIVIRKASFTSELKQMQYALLNTNYGLPPGMHRLPLLIKTFLCYNRRLPLIAPGAFEEVTHELIL